MDRPKLLVHIVGICGSWYMLFDFVSYCNTYTTSHWVIFIDTRWSPSLLSSVTISFMIWYHPHDCTTFTITHTSFPIFLTTWNTSYYPFHLVISYGGNGSCASTKDGYISGHHQCFFFADHADYARYDSDNAPGHIVQQQIMNSYLAIQLLLSRLV